MTDQSGYTDNDQEYWDQSIEQHGRYSSIGLQPAPEDINKYRKEALFSTIKTAVSESDTKISNSSVLDAGCGTGVYSEFYAEEGATVTGIDLSENAIDSIRKLDIPGEYTQGRLHELPYPDDEFDIVHCFSVLYHIADDTEWETALQELQRVLKPSGVLLLRIEWTDKRKKPAEHVTHRPKSEYRRVLIDQGDLELTAEYPIYDVPRTLPGGNLPGIRILNHWCQHFTGKYDIMKKSENQRVLLFQGQ